MKLSEAITKGAQLRPQAFGSLFKFAGEQAEVATSCALGAAYEARYSHVALPEHHFDSYDDLEAAFPLLNAPAQCPVCIERLGRNLTPRERLSAVISHLNDYHIYTRELIAEWVAAQEAR